MSALQGMLSERSGIADAALASVCLGGLVGVLLLTFQEGATAAAASDDMPSIGEVNDAINDVRWRLDGALVWNAASPGQTVHEGDVVYVAAQSFATITLAEGGKLDIDERSLVVLRKPASEEDHILVDVLRGGAVGHSGKRGLRFRAGGTATDLSRGSRARVRLSSKRSAEVEVVEGKATVKGEKGRAVDVSKGQKARVAADTADSPQVERINIVLTAPQDATRLRSAPDRRVVTFRWGEVAGKGPYILELSPDPGFAADVIKRRSRETSVTVDDLAAGVYSWRVRRKGGGLSGTRTIVLIDDLPPSMYRPRAGQVVDLSVRDTIPFGWTPVAGARSYQLQLVKGYDFSAPVFEVEQTATTLVHDPGAGLDEGDYCARARAATGEEERPWSEPACFRLVTRPVLRAPTLFDPDEGDPAPGRSPEQGFNLWWLFGSVAHAAPGPKTITLRWEKIPGAEVYIVEVSETKSFDSVLQKHEVPNNYLKWKPPARRDYYWRVRAVDNAGRLGQMSEARGILLAIPKPELVSPANGTRVGFGQRAPQTTLKWRPNSRLVSFIVELSQNPGFSGAVERQTVKKSSASFELGALGTYHWRVFGENDKGERSAASVVRTLEVYALPPKLLGPAPGHEAVWVEEAPKVALSWSARPVRRYDIQIAPSAEFSVGVTRLRSNKPAVEFQAKDYGTFHWRVRGTDPQTKWSAGRVFAVVAVPPTPLAPEDGLTLSAVGATAPVKLEWEPVKGALGYEVEYTREGGEPVTASADGTALELTLDPGDYTWSVRALIQTGPTGASESRRVSIAEAAIATNGGDGGENGGTNGGNNGSGPAVESLLPAPGDALLFLAPRLAFYYNLGEVVTMQGGVEASYVLPVLERALRLALSVSYFTSSTEASDPAGAIRARSRLHGVPFELSGRYVYPVSVVELVGGIGMSVTVTHATVEVDTQPDRSVTDGLFGGLLVAGAQYLLGPGYVFAELEWSFTTGTSGMVEVNPGGLQIAAGYRIGVW